MNIIHGLIQISTAPNLKYLTIVDLSIIVGLLPLYKTPAALIMLLLVI